MACVLSMSPVYQSQYNENITNTQNIGFKYLDFNCINNGCSDFLDNHVHCGQCQIDTGNHSTKMCRLNISNENVKHGPYSVISYSSHGCQLYTEVSDKQNSTNGNRELTWKPEICKQLDITKNGVKRKAVVTNCDEANIPTKRVSPFLNTPKGRKDERKNILNMCMKKIKELDDPEVFLRRSVLVNNLTKHLQMELRQEKHNSWKFSSYKGKCFGDYKVLSNNCLSDTFLCDDPFLSGIHEAITDDMTDTLISNVLNDNKLNETKGKFDS